MYVQLWKLYLQRKGPLEELRNPAWLERQREAGSKKADLSQLHSTDCQSTRAPRHPARASPWCPRARKCVPRARKTWQKMLASSTPGGSGTAVSGTDPFSHPENDFKLKLGLKPRLPLCTFGVAHAHNRWSSIAAIDSPLWDKESQLAALRAVARESDVLHTRDVQALVHIARRDTSAFSSASTVAGEAAQNPTVPDQEQGSLHASRPSGAQQCADSLQRQSSTNTVETKVIAINFPFFVKST
eukprot:1488006-Amphidinium_carterae.2